MNSQKICSPGCINFISQISRSFSKSCARESQKKCRLLVIGGGTGGCSTAAKFVRKIGAGNVTLIEPADTHYYQPMWTLVGGGIKSLDDSSRSMKSVIPSGCEWIKDKAVKFDPINNTVTTANGTNVQYEYLIVAMGLQLNYGHVKGLLEALEHDPAVVSNYWDKSLVKTFPALQKLQSGNAIFTFPNTPIKCAGAPQKIMYLADDFWRKNGRRENINISFNTALGVIFGVKKYADRLSEIVKKRNIGVNFNLNLIEVKPESKEAIFAVTNSDKGETKSVKYDFLHVTPPMSSPDALRESTLVDQTGYLNVNKETLQHMEYKNIFGIGDCTNVPTSKTAAAVAAQAGILKTNLSAVIDGKPVQSLYNGYTSCPLVTSYSKCILAEFDFNGQPLETFPVDQGKERRSMFLMKKYFMPFLYWNGMLKGYWNGPGVFRKIMRLGQ
ncbi:sulfide:quinone oxidoreductase, mitochondrial [Patella vulgata]|uniref:sulfide:quinone oxidoreductase, mitochondrial n=1 Tax=Patella vulgata TaxID=6465 RepID=UPI00217FAAF6|nr:sulfide:quinone oxidoreductase, mitochondrial [Patella vulgata]